MTFREKINERPSLALGAGAGLIVIAAAAFFLLAGGGGPRGTTSRAYFSDDDGKTYFADDAAKVAPFDHGGKQAVRAHVFAAGGKQFVNHLERQTPEGARFAQAARTAGAGKAPPRPAANAGALSEVKRPGDAAWVPTNDMAKAAPVMTVRLPPGVTGEVTDVEP